MKKTVNQCDKNTAPVISINVKNIMIIHRAGGNIHTHRDGVFGKFLYLALSFLNVLSGFDFLSNLRNL